MVALGIRVLPLSQINQRPVDESELVNEVIFLDEMSSNGDNKDSSLDDMLEDIAFFDAFNAPGA